ncbi:anion transporter [Lactobacillus colini]|uniref:Anion transporter n=1 Tax=Lactobacillus colini TaxID=1819254 RepID=A0ABS4MBS9_9LACO|nr:SLC13 family permease [Lactobacillus colini]MBP2057119.1 anion transporter [Lactobacillus colini]
MTPMWITIIILALTIIAFLTGKVPMSIISMGIILSLIFFKILPVDKAFGGFINPNVIMFAGMFVIGAGITKTSILQRTEDLVMKYKNNTKMLLLISCLSGGILGLLTSGTSSIAILLPLLMGIAASVNVSQKQILFPVATVANIAAGTTFLGVGSGNMTWSSIMMKIGAKEPLNLLSFTLAKLPFLITAIIYMVYVAPKLLPKDEITAIDTNLKKKDLRTTLSPVKEKLAIVIILATITLMILSNYINIPIYVISTLGAALLVIFGILKEKEALSSINLPTIFLFGGVLALSDALTKTGAGDLVASVITAVIGNTNNTFLIMFIFFAIPFIVTQFMSNLATVAIFVPLVVSAALKLGFDPRAAVLAVITAATCSFLTPLASPPQTMIMEVGNYKLWDYLKSGLPLAIIYLIMGCFVFQLIYPL